MEKKYDGYKTLFSGSGDMNCGHGLDIDGVDWENGYSLFCFDLTPGAGADLGKILTVLLTTKRRRRKNLGGT